MYIFTIVVIILFIFAIFYLFLFKQDVIYRKIYRKRSGRDRRRKFIASKNQMRRSGKDRRQAGK